MILGAPTIAKNDRNEPVLIFGTGQYDELSTWNRNRIFSITDKINESGQHEPQINWWTGDLGLEKGDTTFPTVTYPSTWYTDIETEMLTTRLTAKSTWSGAAGDRHRQ